MFWTWYYIYTTSNFQYIHLSWKCEVCAILMSFIAICFLYMLSFQSAGLNSAALSFRAPQTMDLMNKKQHQLQQCIFSQSQFIMLLTLFISFPAPDLSFFLSPRVAICRGLERVTLPLIGMPNMEIHQVYLVIQDKKSCISLNSSFYTSIKVQQHFPPLSLVFLSSLVNGVVKLLLRVPMYY